MRTPSRRSGSDALPTRLAWTWRETLGMRTLLPIRTATLCGGMQDPESRWQAEKILAVTSGLERKGKNTLFSQPTLCGCEPDNARNVNHTGGSGHVVRDTATRDTRR